MHRSACRTATAVVFLLFSPNGPYNNPAIQGTHHYCTYTHYTIPLFHLLALLFFSFH